MWKMFYQVIWWNILEIYRFYPNNMKGTIMMNDNTP